MDPGYSVSLALPHHVYALAVVERDAARLLMAHAPAALLEESTPRAISSRLRPMGGFGSHWRARSTRRGLDPAKRVAVSYRAVSPSPTIEDIWRRYDAVESRLTAPLSERMLDVAGLQPGMNVLDLATGRGEPALRAARRVGPRGSVLGIDLSDGLLDMAREAAVREGLSNLELRAANAEQVAGILPNHFDAVTVRWGLMNMSDPIAALTNARRSLLPTGVLVAALWAEPERASFYALPRRVLARHRAGTTANGRRLDSAGRRDTHRSRAWLLALVIGLTACRRRCLCGRST